ncbi:pyridoxamine 5'-phosphate oxidase family protein [Mycobacterium sp.]|uniref:pyridoxamine 5'-phosphate oxidase family protein n=1 Tax=Mycobacterium sp. TaxID=1785 RepID=UPI003F9B5CE0
MPAHDQPITILSESECWNLLAGVELGRLITNVGGQPEVFPVNFVTQDQTILFRTAEGTKLSSVVVNQDVVFEADRHNMTEGWSVIVKGRAHVLDTRTEIEEAEQAKLLPWIPTLKLRYVRVTASEISGRRFRFGPEPDRESCFA